ncbi:tyrosine-type recombinase/integrase [Rickettsiella endosymbiont of Dermanyssus gallinae]|uniref:tyrosine-type recombinase/integrase n=1 Tax=Rickettsiella endosymbiont of Dermanyssus gallinae TaxID=2856608 RepID=UPI001C52B715|nr:site-specific integrase [Rickettsiella endosymbiont of Dermanyssus gallinae]
MGRKRTSGLLNRKGIWHIDKKILGQRICESTGSDSLEEAEIYLAKRIEEIRQVKIYGVRLQRTFREAATRYLLENQHKSSIIEAGYLIKHLDRFIGNLSLENIHKGTLQAYIDSREKDGVKKTTINQGLEIVRRILNRAAGDWVDENGVTWLATAPKIKLLIETDKRNPFPLNWNEQSRLFAELPLHLQRMALFAVNTGCRDKEICRLQWDWEVKVPELNTSVFIIPGEKVKNRQDRLVVLNQVASQVIREVRGMHPTYVFAYKGHCITRMLNSAWLKARVRAGLSRVRVHDLKHTFGRRLRAAGVSFEDRQDLLGHKSGRITTHYSQVELISLIQAANKVCREENRKPILTVLRRVA